MADKIVVLRLGHIEQVGAPLELYNRPANRFVAGFIGSPKMNFLNAAVEGADASSALLRIGGEKIVLPRHTRAAPGQNRLEFGVRPEHVTLADGEGRIPFAKAKVDLVESLGGQTLLYARLPDGQNLTISLEGQRDISVGASVDTFVDPSTCHLFDSEGRII